MPVFLTTTWLEHAVALHKYNQRPSVVTFPGALFCVLWLVVRRNKVKWGLASGTADQTQQASILHT